MRAKYGTVKYLYFISICIIRTLFYKTCVAIATLHSVLELLIMTYAIETYVRYVFLDSRESIRSRWIYRLIILHVVVHAAEVFVTKCRKCTEKQKDNLAKIVEWYTKNQPDEWNTIVQKLMDDAKKLNITPEF